MSDQQDSRSELLERALLDALGRISEDEKVGRVFHDFNNILSSSMGYANLASERAKNSGDEKLERFVGNIERAGLRARELVRESLEQRRHRREQAIQPAVPWLASWLRMHENELVEKAVCTSLDVSAEQSCLCYNDAELALIDSLTANMISATIRDGVSITLEDYGDCHACGCALRGLQFHVVISQVATLDTNEKTLFSAIVNSRGGHFCEHLDSALVQKQQFDVYLSAMPAVNSSIN